MKFPIEIFGLIRIGKPPKHIFGYWPLVGILYILDGITLLLTFGWILPDFAYQFISWESMYRYRKKLKKEKL